MLLGTSLKKVLGSGFGSLDLSCSLEVHRRCKYTKVEPESTQQALFQGGVNIPASRMWLFLHASTCCYAIFTGKYDIPEYIQIILYFKLHVNIYLFIDFYSTTADFISSS